jgi:hypothetical protein
MSYFDAGIGKRPTEQTNAKEAPAEKRDEETPYFAARLGPCPSDIRDYEPKSGEQAALDAQAHALTRSRAHALTRSRAHALTQCPLCRGSLEAHAGIYRCAGRCGARWLEEAPGRLVDLAALPHGICACCAPPRPLVRGAPGPVCPASGRAHLLLPGGASVLADALPHGVCACCAPPMPLVAQGDALACLARPDRRYRREGQTLIALAPAPAAGAAALEAIDAALRCNSARLTTNGLFDLE